MLRGFPSNEGDSASAYVKEDVESIKKKKKKETWRFDFRY